MTHKFIVLMFWVENDIYTLIIYMRLYVILT